MNTKNKKLKIEKKDQDRKGVMHNVIMRQIGNILHNWGYSNNIKNKKLKIEKKYQYRKGIIHNVITIHIDNMLHNRDYSKKLMTNS